MQALIFTEEFCQPELLHPFTLMRPIQDIQCGLLTLREKWEHFFKTTSVDRWTDDYKTTGRAFKVTPDLPKGNYLMIHSNIHPTKKMVARIRKLKPGQYLTHPQAGGIAFCFSNELVRDPIRITVKESVLFDEPVTVLQHPWQIFQQNGAALVADIHMITKSRKSQRLPGHVRVTNKENIFIEKGASIGHAILNASDGPIYIGKDAVIMDGAIIRGPFGCREGAIVKMGATIYGPVSLGKRVVAGGEIKNSVIMDFSNKGHDGYLGDAVIGTWCNLGAGTTASNVKNTARQIAMYTEGQTGERLDIGVKCGLIMGDYSRSAINTSFNTATMVGLSANVFGQGLTPKIIPNFSWGDDGIQKYRFDRALADIENWKAMKGETINDAEKAILRYIYENF
jgi:UDP-N-acetylglucosamine diphosphorylase / glucose-1-phosphate thymidylyltransferase / UDP-N-acetylgalactosamine diphosphorylase / glucosamine-1-phosphate N-acetyltransferase / galactosamine-1-phosphate N-acetyltransferase